MPPGADRIGRSSPGPFTSAPASLLRRDAADDVPTATGESAPDALARPGSFAATAVTAVAAATAVTQP
ncbi:hypothetical protein JF66_03785 [Cryobacterium sp. MLB-32]|uniref:hypothetical protein n=1 Tax=Cryobacterium sp. MLB-32 TaxID=1529318 RepID=UPI0004E776A4|nr:hypothetical protein [Cryobacterium sp. MLB-32]KFF60544.1 hypothetical protein JF66_03785 [Cryobacterium sp. MLB-32]